MSIGVVGAQSGYNMPEEEYRNQQEDYQDYQMNKGDMEYYKVESKVAAAEEQEEKEQAEASEANKRLLIYVVIGVGGIILVSLISHSWQKHTTTSRSKK